MTCEPRWTGSPLPRGRHKLSREEVQASQRGRLLRAMEELVGEHGYEGATVPMVIKAARVSTATFYRLFSDKADCFIALCEERGERLFQDLVPDEELRAKPAWERLNIGLGGYLNWWQDHPAMARAYFVELPAAGTRALAERERQYEQFIGLTRAVVDRWREDERPARLPSDTELRACLILTTEMIASEIRRGNGDRLADLKPHLRTMLLKLLGFGAEPDEGSRGESAASR